MRLRRRLDGQLADDVRVGADHVQLCLAASEEVAIVVDRDLDLVLTFGSDVSGGGPKLSVRPDLVCCCHETCIRDRDPTVIRRSSHDADQWHASER